MPINRINPVLLSYTEISERKGLLPRCPFASVEQCPRYYQSLSLLGQVGGTKIDPKDDERLLELWRQSDLWPVVDEQASSIMGQPHIFSKFCPEVSFDRFGLFATYLAEYADETERARALSALAKEYAGPHDWRWRWSTVSALHYSDCPLYSPLKHKEVQPKSLLQTVAHQDEKIFDFTKVSFYGFTFNLKALFKRLRAWWSHRQSKM